METIQVTATRVWPVGRRQADMTACLTKDEDISGMYQVINASNLYSPSRGMYLHVGNKTMQKLNAGEPLRFSPSSCS